MAAISAPAVLPPEPSISHRRQVLGWILRPEWLMQRAGRECGEIFTLQTPFGPLVFLSDPVSIKKLFTADPDVARAGEGNEPLEPLVGAQSLLRLDGNRHLRRRRLVLPPLHGEALAAHEEAMAAATRRDIADWPLNIPFALEDRMQAITLDVIVRVVFGIEEAARQQELERQIGRLLPAGLLASLSLLPSLRHDLGPASPYGRFVAARRAVDAILFDEIARHRRDGASAERTDILALLIAARDEDGAPLTDQELRDELVTLLVAGHETTATTLAWCFELLFRRPDALARCRDEARAGGETPYLDATIREVQRLKPVIPIVTRRITEPMELAGRLLPAGTVVAPCIHLVHRRADLYPEPQFFLPERFLDAGTETYEWLAFGGGRRRCVGAAFAQLEMRTVLRTVLTETDLRPARDGELRTKRRAIVLSPRDGATAIRAL